MAFDDDHYGSMLRMFAPLAAVAAFIGMMVFGNKPPPPPDIPSAFGCYLAESAPAISLSGDGMHIHQAGAERLAFTLERHKNGIALTVMPWIDAEPAGQRYHYRISRNLGGRFVPFHKVINGQNYGVFKDYELNTFTIRADDGHYLTYRKAPEPECGDQATPAS